MLDPAGIAICTNANDQYFPKVAPCGTDFLVAWQDLRNQDATAADIYGTRVSSSGRLLDIDGIAICTNARHQGFPAAASNARGAVVVWEERWDASISGRNLYGVRVNTGGTVLDPDGVPLITAAHNQTQPALAADQDPNQDLTLLVWKDNRNQAVGGTDIYAGRVGTVGGNSLLSPDGDGFPICTEAHNQGNPAVASNQNPTGTVWLVAREDERNLDATGRDIYGSSVSSTAEVADPSGLPICDGAGNQTYPAITFDGPKYLVAYLDSHSPARASALPRCRQTERFPAEPLMG